MTTHSLKIVYDTNPDNPWTTDDGLPPLVAFHDGAMDSYGFDNHNPFTYLLNQATDEQLETIRTLFKLDPEDDIYSHHTIDRDTISLELIAQTLNIFSTYRWTARRYGDAIDCIFISRPEHISTAELESYAELFDAYAWGNVYGYQLIEHIPLYTADGTLSTKTEDLVIDSCYGFYGDEGLNDIKDNLPEEHKHLFAEASHYTNIK